MLTFKPRKKKFADFLMKEYRIFFFKFHWLWYGNFLYYYFVSKIIYLRTLILFVLVSLRVALMGYHVASLSTHCEMDFVRFTLPSKIPIFYLLQISSYCFFFFLPTVSLILLTKFSESLWSSDLVYKLINILITLLNSDIYKYS